MRIIIFILLVASVFLIPWWMSVLACVVVSLGFRRYFCALIPALFLDILHGGALIERPFVSATLWVALALTILLFAEPHLRDALRS